MDNIRQYLLSVVASAIVSSIAVALVQRNHALSVIIKLLCGIFMAITVISPFSKFSISDFQGFTQDFSIDAQTAVENGEWFSEQQLRENISQQVEAYIQERAQDLGVDLRFDIELSAEMPPVPLVITIYGAASPYEKSILCDYIEKNLAIPEEKQVWM